MNTQAVPPTINSATSASVTGTAPQLGAMIPGTTGGLPALSGLSVTQNPMAQQLQSMGRGDDKVLVHMTPEEVNSLQGLAMASGGSLTINPHTGLPEAGWLGKLLPTLLGFAGAAFGLPTWAIGLGGAAAGTAATGDLTKGLMIGLQAFGGASLAGGIGVGEAGKQAAEAAATAGSGGAGGATGALSGPPPIDASLAGIPSQAVPGMLPDIASVGTGMVAPAAAAAAPAAQLAAQQAPNVLSKTPGFFSKFGAAAKAGMPGGVLSKAAPALAASGLLSGVSAATAPNLRKYEEEDSGWDYKGPYLPAKRTPKFQTPEQMRESGGAEFEYFTPSNPVPGYVPSTMLTEQEKKEYGFADGGAVMTPPQGFNDLVSYFGAGDPGAITASMYPTTAAAPTTPTAPAPSTGGETLYNFSPPPANVPPPPTSMDFGYLDIPGIGNVQIPGFSGYEWNNIDWDTIARQQGYIPQSQAIQLNTPSMDLSGLYDRFGALESQLQSLPTQMPTYQEPDLSGLYDRFGAIESRLQQLPTEMPTYQAPDLSGIYDRFGAIESRLQQLPTELPTYQQPDLSGIYDRFGAIESRLQQLPTEMPTYQQPDLSGIYDRLNQFDARLESLPLTYDLGGELSGLYDRFGAIESQLQSLPREMPTYQQPDLSGIYDRFGGLESRLNSMPTYQAPDLSGIYSRLDQLGSQFNSMPSYQAPDLSGIYDRFGNIESQLQSLPRELPTYQQPDLSSIYDRFGNIESQLQSLPRELPTYQQPDLSGIYDRFGAIESQLQSLPRELPTYQQPDLSGIYSQLEQIRSMFAPQYESGPITYDMNADQYQSVGEFAEGGTVNMRDGSFVVDARTVSELGNGSSNAGMELLSRMGGKPVRGPGDGVSDSVKASIGGKQEARVARDEVIFPPEAVRRMGGGNEKRGTAKLYSLMEHAHKARKKAKRGQDTKVRSKIA
jgi:hypothetical protein